MTTVRQNKVSRLLQKEMGDIFQKEGAGMFPGVLLTVTYTEMSPDLSIAKIHLSILGKLKPQEVLEMLMANRAFLRNELARKVKRQLRIVPDLRFYIDESYEATKRIDELLHKQK